MNSTRLAAALVLVAAAGWVAGAAAQGTHPQHTEPSKDSGKGMGFDETRTSHHFRLTPTGGTIEVHVRNPDDRGLRDQVVGHLKIIAEQFARGDFSAPFAVHAEEPAGVPALKRAGKDIVYKFAPDESGGRVMISTASKQAREAVHAFLRYQIREHRTGDSTEVGGR